MNGVDRTKFDRIAAAPYIGRQVRWHDQTGSFRNDAQGGLVWTPDSGANLGSNGIEDITGKLGVSTGQAGGMQYQYDPATGGVTSTGKSGTLPPVGAPAPPSPGPGQQGQPATPSAGPGQQPQPPGPSFPSEEAKSQNAMFSAAFGSRQGDPNFNVNFDYNQDGIINYDDHLQFGQSFTPPPPVDPATQQIDSHVESMISTLGDQRTRYGQAPSEQYYQQYLDGYKTHLQSLSEDQRNDYFAAPHKSYRDYVIDQLDATPELGNILRGKWTGENVNAVAQSIASGQGILNLEYLDSIPEELLSSSNKEHIKGLVNSILNPPPSSTKPVRPDLAAGDPSGEATDLEVGEGDVVSGDVVSGDDLSSQIDGLATLMRGPDGKRLGDDYYRNLLTEDGYTPEQVEHILRESRSRATGADTNVDNIFSQMQDGTFDEDAIRAQLLQEGYTPNEVSALIANATTRHEEAEYGVLQDEFSEWLNTQLPLLAQSGDGDTFTKTLMQWKNRGLSEEDLGAANQAWSQQGGSSNWQAQQGPPVDDGVAEGFPPGWVDADNDGFDDNTDLDIDGTPRVFTQEGPEQFEGTATKPAMPDTDDTINDLVTYLRDASETQDGIDNIAANDLNRLSTEAERAQEQLLEDLNRLGLVGLESGDAQAAIGEFKGKVLAQQHQIRADSDQRIRDNIDKLIEVAGLEVSKSESEFRIKQLEDSIKSADQRALFRGVMELLGPDGFNLVGGLFGGDGQPGSGAGTGTGTGTPSWGQDIYNVPQTLRNIPGLKDADFSNVYNDDGTVVEGMFQYKNAGGDIVHIPKDFNIATDPGAIQLRAQGFTDKEILGQMAATKPPKWFDASKMKQAAGFLAAGEVAGEVLPGALGSISKGASQGAAIGSVVPVIGTAVGAAIGAGIAAATNFLGINMSGHNDRQIESSWHPAILDVLYQNGFTPRDKVSKEVLDEIATQLNIPYEGSNSEAFRRSSHYRGADIENQDKLWAKQYEEGKLSREDLITMSLASSVGNSGIDLNKWGRSRRA